MENTRLCVWKDVLRKRDPLSGFCKDTESSDEDSSIFSASKPKKLVKRASSHRAIVVNIVPSQFNKVLLKDLFFRCVYGLDNRIPKHMVSADEKYLRRCLEFIHISALKAARCNMPMNSRSKNMEISSESLNAAKFIHGDGWNSAEFVFKCPVTMGTDNVVISANAAEEWTLGTVMGSKSMLNLLNNPLLQQFGALDSNGSRSRMNMTDSKGLICYDFMDSPSGLSISSYNLDKKTSMVQSHKFCSTSSINSTCSDQLSSAPPTMSLGMLQCRWKKGIPRFVFSADDQKEVYVAKLRKVDQTNDKDLDYMYLFYLNKVDSQKGCEIPNNNLQLVGRMNVKSSLTFCPNNCRIMETEFVFFGSNEICNKEMYTPNHTHRKNKGLSKKVSQVFRTSPSLKHRNLSKFGGSSATMKSSPWETHALGVANLLDTNVPSNFELAAIVAKNHLPCNRQDKVGWGLSFLKKSGVKETSLHSEHSGRNTGDCSTSMDILIPAGLHGGPRTRNGGPSSLIDRWKSGGHCDCGGWDMGCPLTVLQRRLSGIEVLSQEDKLGEYKSVDLVAQVRDDRGDKFSSCRISMDQSLLHGHFCLVHHFCGDYDPFFVVFELDDTGRVHDDTIQHPLELKSLT